MATKTKKPSGLTIARNNYTFFCTWKIGDKDYGDGQQFQYRVNAGAWTNLGTSANIGKTATSAAFSINPALYYPTAGKGSISSVTFRVRGNRKTYKQKKKSIKPGWSDWTEKAFTIRAPLAPSNSAALDEEADNKCVFSGSGTSNEDDTYMFTRLEWQTALTTDSGTPNYGGTNVVNSTSWSTTQTEDTSVINDGHSHTRYVRVRAVGVGGASAWIVAKHVYAVPNKPTNIKASATLRSGGVDVLMTFNTANSGIRPIDNIKSEYLLTTPGAGISIPSGASWTAGGTTVYKDGSDTVRMAVNSPLDVDNVIFARAATVHDRNENPGNAVVAAYGALSNPTAITVTMGSTNTIQVQATNNSDVPDSFLAVYYHDKSKSSTAYVAGIIAHGDTSVNITVPAWSNTNNISVGVQAVVGVAHASTKADGSTSYSITPFSGKQIMRSAIVWQKIIPRPANVAVGEGSRNGVARVTWSWNSSSVDGVEISWADHDDAWQSTDEPEEYQVSILYSPEWNISGLETGRTWYFKLRFYMNDGNTTEYSPWTDMVSLDLTSAPQTPSLILSNEAVIEGETFDASWAYVTTDGTRQTYAEIALVTDSEGTLTYGNVIAKTTTSQRITIDPKELGWTVGQTKLLALRVVSSSGRSSEWSGYQPIHIVEPVTCEITSTSLVSETADGRTYMALKDMPMTVTVTGAGNTNTTSLVIERADSYHLDRPDEGHYDGYKGEAIYVHSQTGDAQITINLEALIGRLDDGASYKIVATVNDQYGQKATATQDFEVHWTEQATVPYGTGYIDPEYNVGIIIPIAPPEASSTDVCDIYRLTADQPQLIYSGATFGELYVDPYPTIGDYGGYRVVLKTENEDYITADNHFAWVDTDGSLNMKGGIIDFDDNQVRVHRNFDVSHSWEKDFTETQYLGGSVQGDWNPAISRSGSISAVTITLLDEQDILAMRDLAAYPGICTLRTEDGSNYKCDVQVSESRSHDKGGFIPNYSLKITRVDPQGYDAMPLVDWLSGQNGYELVISDLDGMAEEMDFPEGYYIGIDSNDHIIMNNVEPEYEAISYSIVNGELVVTTVTVSGIYQDADGYIRISPTSGSGTVSESSGYIVFSST